MDEPFRIQIETQITDANQKYRNIEFNLLI